MTTTILMLTANPTDTSSLRLAQEERDVRNGLDRSKERDTITLYSRHAVRHQDVRRAMLDYSPNIVHFSGHGLTEGIVLEDEQGRAHIVSTNALATLFELFAQDIHCVVLNACYSESQAKAIVQHIPYVVGMNKAIGDKAAIEFAISFYDAIGAGRPIEFAYKLGCNAIQMAGIPEHLTPVLKKKADVSPIKTPLIRRQPLLAEEYSDNYKNKLDKILQDISVWESTLDWLSNNMMILIDPAIEVIKEDTSTYYGRGLDTEEETHAFKESIVKHFQWILHCLEKGSVRIPIAPYLNKTTMMPDAYCSVFTLISDNIRIIKADVAKKDEELLKLFLTELSKHYC